MGENTHFLAKLQTNLRDLLNIKTASTHKEVVHSTRRKFAKDVTYLKIKLDECNEGSNFAGPAKMFGTGEEVS